MHLRQKLDMNHGFQCPQIVGLSGWPLCETDSKVCQSQGCSVVRSCWLSEIGYLARQDRYLRMSNGIWGSSKLQMMRWPEPRLTLRYMVGYTIAFEGYSYSLLHPSECALKTSNIRTLTAAFLVGISIYITNRAIATEKMFDGSQMAVIFVAPQHKNLCHLRFFPCDPATFPQASFENVKCRLVPCFRSLNYVRKVHPKMM